MKIRDVDIQYSDKHPGQKEFWKSVQDGIWEPQTLDVLDRYTQPGKTFIDIGAWNGVLSMYALKRGAQVESVECDPKAIDMLVQNSLLNTGSLFISTCAISNENGLAILESHNGDWGNSMSTIVDRKEQKGQVTVMTLTLEGFVETRGIEMSNVSLIKIDTEGAEALIIPSSKEFLAKHKPTILLSLHSFWFPDFEKNVTDIIDAIFPTYKVSPIWAYKEEEPLLEHTPETFREEMLKYRCCDVLLNPLP